jgi:hypothetical protein
MTYVDLQSRPRTPNPKGQDLVTEMLFLSSDCLKMQCKLKIQGSICPFTSDQLFGANRTARSNPHRFQTDKQMGNRRLRKRARHGCPKALTAGV